MLKSLADTVPSFTSAAFARVAMVASSTDCPAVSLPFIRLHPVASRATAVTVTIFMELRIHTPATQLVGLHPVWLVLSKSNAHDSNWLAVLLSKMCTWGGGMRLVPRVINELHDFRRSNMRSSRSWTAIVWVFAALCGPAAATVYELPE